MNRHLPFPRGEDGHTLIELAIVLLMIGISVSLAAPSMNRFMARSRVERAIERVAADIAYSRILAIRDGTPVLLTFQSGTRYTISLPSSARTLRTVSLEHDLPGVRLRAPTSDSKLQFDSQGILKSVGTGLLTATSGAVIDSATVTLAGKVYRVD